ncbi:MAG TPA: hypothetical protein ENK91_07310 [Bacteroidetes bacterium]|nr:hypothetical protein [Bacteroidota bacterium]
MGNKVEILSPGKNCRKTSRLIKYLKIFFKENNIEAEFVIVDNADEFEKYKTWILPTIIINGNIVARGYKPADEVIFKSLIK